MWFEVLPILSNMLQEVILITVVLLLFPFFIVLGCRKGIINLLAANVLRNIKGEGKGKI